jgi:hypothetical protein
MLLEGHAEMPHMAAPDVCLPATTAHAGNTSIYPSAANMPKNLIAVIQAELDKHNAQNPPANDPPYVFPSTASPVTHSSTSPLYDADDITPSRRDRTRVPPPLRMHACIQSITSVFSTTLTAGPAAYMYTPLTARRLGFESLRDDHGITFMTQRHAIVALLVRWQLWVDEEHVGKGNFMEKVSGFMRRKKNKFKTWIREFRSGRQASFV